MFLKHQFLFFEHTLDDHFGIVLNLLLRHDDTESGCCVARKLKVSNDVATAKTEETCMDTVHVDFATANGRLDTVLIILLVLLPLLDDNPLVDHVEN